MYTHTVLPNFNCLVYTQIVWFIELSGLVLPNEMSGLSINSQHLVVFSNTAVPLVSIVTINGQIWGKVLLCSLRAGTGT